jgi:hypothetical protein
MKQNATLHESVGVSYLLSVVVYSILPMSREPRWFPSTLVSSVASSTQVGALLIAVGLGLLLAFVPASITFVLVRYFRNYSEGITLVLLAYATAVVAGCGWPMLVF